MDRTIAAIRLLDAIAGGIRQAPGPEGDDRIVAVSDQPMLAVEALRDIAQALDWRLDQIDAVRTNFHDLVTEGSPLRSKVGFWRESDLQHVVAVQSATPALLADFTYRKLLEGMAFDLPVVLCMDEVPEGDHGWTVVDLRGSR